MAASSGKSSGKITNRKAFHDYTVLDRYECGMELQGTEIKSIRNGEVTLTGGFALVDRGQVWLRDVYIKPYEYGNRNNHEATRPRRLLLHKREILKLESAVSREGCTLVPLNIHFKRGYAKLELGVCKGKQHQDKRQDLRKKDADRAAARAMRRGEQ